MPYIQRQTDKGLPEYNDKDTFVETGGEELVPVGDGIYRHKNESAFIKYTRNGEVWQANSKSGEVFRYGMSAESQIRNGNKIFRWLLEKMTDPNGNTILYQYISLDDNPHKYCSKIIYNNHEIVFEYESRPDILPDYRPTFRLETGFRCKSVSMLTNGKLIRRYNFAYEEDSYISLLKSVTQIGNDGKSELPPATFTYTKFDPSKAKVTAIEGDSPSFILKYEPDITLNDMNSDGLPDLLIAKPGDHQVYFNMGVASDGKHRWGNYLEMGDESPAEALRNDAVSLADIDGDGKTDFIARRSIDTYFVWTNSGAGKWNSVKTFADKSGLAFDFENPAVRLADINNDKHIDVMYCNDSSGDTYSYFINNKGAEFTEVIVKNGLGNALTFDQEQGMKLADMNGDRLEDIVLLKDGICLYYPSMGMGNWDAEQKMTNPPDSDKTPGIYNDWAELMLIDLNGDGLTDILYAPDYAGYVMYWLNRDSRKFEGPFEVKNTPVKLGDTDIQPADMNGNGTTDLLWNYPEDSDINPNKTWQYLELCPDEKPYLLKTVKNGIGRTITFYYSTSVQEYIRDKETAPWKTGVPHPVNILSAFDVEDGMNRYRTELKYHDGYYDGKEKEFRGFEKAEKKEIGDASVPDLIISYTFDTGAVQEALKGKPLILSAQTANGEVFYKENYTWKTKELAAGADGNTGKVTFPYQQAKLVDILEKGIGTPVQMKWEYEYDNYGNMTRQTEHGRLDSGWDDERITISSFSAGYASGLSKWILDRPVETSVTDENGTLTAKKRNYYDGNQNPGEVSKGNLTKTDDWVNGDKYIISVRNDYDEYGNIIAAYDPLYPNQPGHWRKLVYDSVYHTFPVQEIIYTGKTDLPSLTMSATYDYGFGVMTSSTDFNGFTTDYGYDTFGRLISVIKPPDTTHTLEYDYVLAHDLGNSKIINWVETRQKDSSSDGFLKSRTFYDGLSRKIMTRSEGENSGQVVVTDTVKFNARKSEWKKYLPYFETGTLDFVDPIFNTGFTEHFYDAMEREIRVNQPLGTDGIVYSATTYKPLIKFVQDEEQTNSDSPHFGCGMRYVEDGLQDKDGNGRLRLVYEVVKLTDLGETGNLTEWLTSYSYDLQDNLTGYTDSQGNQKIMEYDGVKRKTFMNDPDRGKMYYSYNDAGNLIQTKDAKSQVIKYAYDGVNRLTSEYYGENKTTPDVEYHYDTPFGAVGKGDLWQTCSSKRISGMILTESEADTACDLNKDGKLDVADVVKTVSLPEETVTAKNTKGFLSYVKDLSGEEHNSYDSRGRVEWVVKKIGLNSYYTANEYDSTDRVTKLFYPDKSYITYNYNARGLLESVPNVINQYDYNPSGQNSKLSLVCGTVTDYSYDHRLRLNNLKTLRSKDSLALQDLTYIYDGVSDITQIKDGRSNTALDPIGKELGILSDESRKFNATQSFDYDSLYRLTQASNSSVYGVINYRYDRIGNMINKSANLIKPDSLMDLGTMTCGGILGTKNRIGRNAGDAPGPHAVTSSEKGVSGAMKFEYDDNGNMISDNGMSLSWDYKDRLISLKKDTKTAGYVYDYTDTRKKKTVTDSADGNTSEAVYIDKFSEIRDGKLIKYVYAGNSRIARSDKSDFQISNFYLHDHLGSTSFTLSDTGSVTEQLVNYPYGSPRIEKRAVTALNGADYKFTGKERDLESGLQYFEARYMNDSIGSFISVDLISMIEDSNNSPQEINSYRYSANNPIGYIDPTGLAEEKINEVDPMTDTMRSIDSLFQKGTQVYFDEGQSSNKTYGARVTAYEGGERVNFFEGPVKNPNRISGSTLPNTSNSKYPKVAEQSVKYKQTDYKGKPGAILNPAGGKFPSQQPARIVETTALNKSPYAGNKGSGVVNGVQIRGQNRAAGVYIHSGHSEKGTPSSRGSVGCLTIRPPDNSMFFRHISKEGAVHINRK